LVTGVSPTIVRWLRDRAHCPVELVTNGYLAAAQPLPPAQSPPIRLVYAGSLAYGRDLRPVLQAVAALGLGPQQLVVDVAGPHGAGVLAQAAALGLDPALVVDHGSLSSARALEMVQAGHVALVLGSPGFEYAYPGKIFEILSINRPMWLLSPPGADAQTLIEDHQLGWVSDPADSAEVQRTLAAILRGPPPQPRDLESLQAPVVMDRLEKLLRGVAGA
jgi:glycosyltransferase involved in cell wall biosynthesis